mmetsp:Transcript_60627/g.120032  ORF Transcript_60627/g.120032 Transcript_60627/m.120032 type:complete len:83 (-) Transcript_60627:109-357(-)
MPRQQHYKYRRRTALRCNTVARMTVNDCTCKPCKEVQVERAERDHHHLRSRCSHSVSHFAPQVEAMCLRTCRNRNCNAGAVL